MLKMIIRMDDNKINGEKKYRLRKIYRTIDNAFTKTGLSRMEDMSGSLVYRDNGQSKDYGLFGKMVNVLKRQPWFMENVAEWLLCDSDDSDNSDDFNEEDLLSHYRKKSAMGVYYSERKYYKALNFDLDTHRQKEYYSGTSYRKAYDNLRRFFERRN